MELFLEFFIFNFLGHSMSHRTCFRFSRDLSFLQWFDLKLRGAAVFPLEADLHFFQGRSLAQGKASCSIHKNWGEFFAPTWVLTGVTLWTKGGWVMVDGDYQLAGMIYGWDDYYHFITFDLCD